MPRHPLLTVLLALMVAFGSILFANGPAMAAGQAADSVEMAESDHCGGSSDQSDRSTPMGDRCCIAMGAALPAVIATANDSMTAFERMDDRPFVAGLGQVFAAKLPTPPPRSA